VYSLPSGYEAVTGETIQASQHNPPLEDIASSMSQRLMRSGAAPMTGPLKVVDGSAGSPAIQFANGSSTGIYKTADGFAVSVGGTKVVEFTSAGIIKSARFIGEIFDWTGTTAPPLCVLPYGQTLLRSAYPDLWAFAQTEIANANTFFNNGNGTTTFGIGDCRGRVRIGKDNMGGTPSGRITSGNFGSNPNAIGSTGGVETKTLSVANLPPYTPAGSVTVTSTSSDIVSNTDHTVAVVQSNGGSNGFRSAPTFGAITSTGTITGVAQGGLNTPFPIVQPSIVTNCALFAGA
jgi:microcystin-dependent protein